MILTGQVKQHTEGVEGNLHPFTSTIKEESKNPPEYSNLVVWGATMDINGNNLIKNMMPLSDSTAVKRKKEMKEGKLTPEYKAVIEKAEQLPGNIELRNAVREANNISILQNRRLNFSIDEATKRIVVKVIDENTDEVVRQIPTEEMLKLAAHFKNTNSLIYDSNNIETSSD